MTDFLTTATTVDTLIERLDDGDVTNVSIGYGRVHLSIADVDALARVADLIGSEPYLLPREGTPYSQHVQGQWRGELVEAATGFVSRAAS